MHYAYAYDHFFPKSYLQIEPRRLELGAFKFVACRYKLITIMKWRKDLDEKSGVCGEVPTDRPEEEIAKKTIEKLELSYDNQLTALEDLWNGYYLISKNHEYTAGILKNGNFIISKSASLDPGKMIWNAEIVGSYKGPFVLRMQRDGNLVVYSEGYNATWHTNTYDKKDAYLTLTDDGKLILYDRDDKPIWSSH